MSTRLNTFNKNFEMYLMMHAGCMQYAANDANEWAKKRKETGGPLLGLFTQGRRPVIMLAAPGGPNTCHETAHFAMDHDYVTWLNQYMLDNFGLQYVGDWHLHIVDMDHASDGDVNHIHRLAGRQNLETMVQLVLTCQKITVPNQQPTGFSGIKERFLGSTKFMAAETDTKEKRHPGDENNRSRIKVNAFLYAQAANSPYHRCPIKILPEESPIQKALDDTGILDIPGKPRFENYPFEKIIYDEVKSVPGTATEQYIPYILVKELNELTDEITRQAEVCIYNEGQIMLSLPLSNNHRLSVTYTAQKSPPRIGSVNVFFQDTKTVIDLTNEILANNDHTALSLIHRLAEEKIRGRKIKRLTSIIRSSRYFTSRFHKNKEI